MKERASSRIADALTQAGAASLDQAAAFALGQGFLASAQGAAALYANLVAEQQQQTLNGQAAANAAVQRFLAAGGPPESTVQPAAGAGAPTRESELLQVEPPPPGIGDGGRPEATGREEAETAGADELTPEAIYPERDEAGPPLADASKDRDGGEAAALDRILQHTERLLDVVNELTGTLARLVDRSPVVT